MPQIEQTYTINAPVNKVYLALTDTDMALAWGAGPAKVNAVLGGEFSYWGGDIHGIFTQLVDEKLIEQDWYGHDHPDRKFTASFAFTTDGKTTTVRLTYAGPIEDEQKDIQDWQDYYFTPIKKLLEQ
jgi:activator of HSP90 ATPase